MSQPTPLPPSPESPSLGSESAVHQVLLMRIDRLHARLRAAVQGLPEADAKVAASAESDLEAWALALEHSPLAPVQSDPVTAAAYARGREVREALLAAEGGVASSEELGKLLGITRQAIDKRRRNGKLFAVRERGDWFYPRWQVADGEVLDGLDDVLAELCQGELGPWDFMVFFLRTNTEREGESPLQALRAGRRDVAVRAARMYCEHGAR